MWERALLSLSLFPFLRRSPLARFAHRALCAIFLLVPRTTAPLFGFCAPRQPFPSLSLSLARGWTTLPVCVLLARYPMVAMLRTTEEVQKVRRGNCTTQPSRTQLNFNRFASAALFPSLNSLSLTDLISFSAGETTQRFKRKSRIYDTCDSRVFHINRVSI